jgi:hypothetical protein
MITKDPSPITTRILRQEEILRDHVADGAAGAGGSVACGAAGCIGWQVGLLVADEAIRA